MSKVNSVFRELLALGGVASVCFGLFCIYQPLAFIVGGALAFWFAVPPKGK